MSTEEKLSLLNKQAWTVNELADYLEIGKNKALEVRRQVIEKEPEAKPIYLRGGVFVDSVLRLVLHSSRENERRKWL